MNKQCVNCPGAVDHSTAECPMRASLPVGVPSIRDFADEVKQLCKDFSDLRDRPYMGDVTAAIDGLYEQFIQSVAMLAAAPAAPTVKAEQVQCACVYANSRNTPSVRKGYEAGGYLKEECKACAAPSLPAAGSAVEEVEVAATMLTPRRHRWQDVLVRGKHDPRMAGDNYNVEPLMTVAQHNRIVAALSAQQSAPELVSVPVELAQRLANHLHELHEDDSAAALGDELRALLAAQPEQGTKP